MTTYLSILLAIFSEYLAIYCVDMSISDTSVPGGETTL